jgi:hypothetical protein
MPALFFVPDKVQSIILRQSRLCKCVHGCCRKVGPQQITKAILSTINQILYWLIRTDCSSIYLWAQTTNAFFFCKWKSVLIL